MKINPRICLTKQQDVIACICLKTGIAGALSLPQLPVDSKGKGFVFEYIHPLSYWSNAQGMIKAGRSYLELLEPQVLSGLLLTAYEHYNLLDRYELTAVEANAILCTASKDTLVEVCTLAAYLTDKNAEYAPALVLEWKDIKDMQTIDRQLDSYIKTLRQEFISPIKEDNNDPMRRIQILNASIGQGKTFKNGVTLLSNKASMASFEKDFEQTFKAAKKEIKELVQSLKASGISSKLTDFLSTVCAGRNLVAMSSEVRSKLQEKLNALGSTEAHRIAKLLSDCINPYDIFAKADEGLDRASDSFVAPPQIRSLKEILEAKKLAANPSYCVAREAELSGGVTNPSSNNSISGGGAVSQSSTLDSNDEADDEVEELLDLMPDGEALDDNELSEEDDGLEDCTSFMAKSLYSSKDF